MNTPAPDYMRLDNRRILTLEGPDTRSLLQRVVTADVETLDISEARPCALLTPQGKLMLDFLVFADGNTVWLDVPQDQVEMLKKRLSLYKLKADVEIRLDEALCAAMALSPLASLPADPRLPDLLWRGVVSRDDDLPVGDEALAALEIANGIPAFGRDYGENDVFPTDVNLDVYGGIGWQKGCFIGQEVVSRMKRRGTIRKRSVQVRFDGDAAPVGTDLKAGNATLGRITSTQGSDAVALIRLDGLDAAEAPVLAGEQSATVIADDALRPDEAAQRVE